MKSYSTPKHLKSCYEEGIKRTNDITQKINLLTSNSIAIGNTDRNKLKGAGLKRININLNKNCIDSRPNSNIKDKITDLRRNMEAKMK
jgi:hypothetical protein